jgi:hypothetical protein
MMQHWGDYLEQLTNGNVVSIDSQNTASTETRSRNPSSI